MAIDFDRTFGAPAQTASRRGGNTSDQPKAQVWLNIGYSLPPQGDDDKYTFVSLPVGIALDTMEGITVRGKDPEYREFQSARNDLMEQLQEMASKLAPGQAGTIKLEVQMRRVEDEQAPVATEGNRFARPVVMAD